MLEFQHRAFLLASCSLHPNPLKVNSMFDKEAIQALQESQSIQAALKAVQEAEHLVALPSDFKLHDIEHLHDSRRRARGAFSTRFVVPFAAYTTQHMEAGATVFVDPESLTATAVLNLGKPDHPGHADNLAELQLKRTAAYAALCTIVQAPRSQIEMAEFLEDWQFVQCFNDEAEVKRPKAIAAIRKITIDSSRKQETSEQQLGATRSAFESVQASSFEPLPTVLHFKCKPYADLAERLFVLRLSVLTSEAKPKIVLRVQSLETHAEEMAIELADLVSAAFTDPVVMPVLVGKYRKQA